MNRIRRKCLCSAAVLAAMLPGVRAMAGAAPPAPPQRPGPQPYQTVRQAGPPVAYLGSSTETMAMIREIREVNTQIQLARQKLTSDTETARLWKAFQEANAAYTQKLKEKLDASTETAKLRKESDEILAKLRGRSVTTKERRELSRRRRQVTQRLRDIELEVRRDPDVAALAKKVETASRAHEERVTARLKADPEAAKLLEKQEELRKQMNEIRARYQKAPAMGQKPSRVGPQPPPKP